MKLAAIAFSLALTGCATTTQQTPLTTESGRPEIVISAATKKQVVDRVVERGLSAGWSVKSTSENAVVLAKKADSFAASFVYGSRYDSTPEVRAHFYPVEHANGVKLFASGEIVTNPGSGYERATDITEQQGHDLQRMLMQIKQTFGR